METTILYDFIYIECWNNYTQRKKSSCVPAVTLLKSDNSFGNGCEVSFYNDKSALKAIVMTNEQVCENSNGQGC